MWYNVMLCERLYTVLYVRMQISLGAHRAVLILAQTFTVVYRYALVNCVGYVPAIAFFEISFERNG